MPPAIIGGAIAAVGAVGSAVIGSKAAGNAAKANQQAADTASAEQRAAREQAYTTLNPFVNTGTQASGAINALLGLTPTNQQQQQVMPPTNVPYADNFDMNGMGDLRNRWAQVLLRGQSGQQQIGTPPIAGPAQQPSYLTPQQAFDNYRNSTGYQFRLDQGLNALNSGYAGAGTLKSGAALKGITEYGQNLASAEFGNYLNALGNQQAIGLQAGSAAAGVGTNAANSLGTIAMNNGNNQANAALLKAQNTGQALNSLASIGANIFGQQIGGR